MALSTCRIDWMRRSSFWRQASHHHAYSAMMGHPMPPIFRNSSLARVRQAPVRAHHRRDCLQQLPLSGYEPLPLCCKVVGGRAARAVSNECRVNHQLGDVWRSSGTAPLCAQQHFILCFASHFSAKCYDANACAHAVETTVVETLWSLRRSLAFLAARYPIASSSHASPVPGAPKCGNSLQFNFIPHYDSMSRQGVHVCTVVKPSTQGGTRPRRSPRAVRVPQVRFIRASGPRRNSQRAGPPLVLSPLPACYTCTKVVMPKHI